MCPQSNAVRLLALVERGCAVIAQFATISVVVLSGILFLYSVGGFFTIALGVFDPRYPFLSLNEDPLFISLVFTIALTICLATSAVILSTLLAGVDDLDAEIAIIAAFVGLGFGAGVMRITLPDMIDILRHISG